MADPTVKNRLRLLQYNATSGQTTFTYNWLIYNESDLSVYKRATGTVANDSTDILTLTTDYTVTGVGDEDGGTVVLNAGATLNDVVTIIGNTTKQRLTVYASTDKFSETAFNTDFNSEVIFSQENWRDTAYKMPKYPYSAVLTSADLVLPQLSAKESWRMAEDGSAIEAVEISENLPGEELYGVTTGAANTYAVTITDFPGYSDGISVYLKINVNNSGASTLNVNGLGAIDIKKDSSTNLELDDLVADRTYKLVYHDSTFFMLDTKKASHNSRGLIELATQGQVDTGTDTTRAVTPATLAGKVATTTAQGITQLATQAEVDAGTVSTKCVTPATLANHPIVSTQGYLYGFTLSNAAADTDHDITLSAGAGRSADNTVYISASSAITKRLDATWADGTNSGGRARYNISRVRPRQSGRVCRCGF